MKMYLCVLALLAGCLGGVHPASLSLDPQQAALAAAVESKDWTAVHNILAEINRNKFDWVRQNYMLSPFSFGSRAAAGVDVRDLRPAPGGRVYGKSVSTYISSLERDGHTEVKSGGHEVENLDGNVTERDFNPLATRRTA